MSRAIRAFTLFATLVSSPFARAGDDLAAADQLRRAAERGLAVVQKAARNYPKHRKCFSCHHQTLPMQATVVAREQGLAPDGKLLQTQTEFTRASFNGRLEHLQSGKRIDPINVSFGLWALELGDHPADDTTTAMIAFLLKKQRPEGSWGRGSHRPPLQQSEVTSTVLAVHYMGKFVGDEQRAAVEVATARAKAWLVAVEPRTQEDRNSRLARISHHPPATAPYVAPWTASEPTIRSSPCRKHGSGRIADSSLPDHDLRRLATVSGEKCGLPAMGWIGQPASP